MFLLKWMCSRVSQNGSGPHRALLLSDTAFICLPLSASADGLCVHGMAVTDFATASLFQF